MANQTIIETRRHQMFPVLEPEEIERVRRFGELRAFRGRRTRSPASARWRRGLMIILCGQGRRLSAAGRTSLVDRHARARRFMGELAQLGGRAGAGRRASRREPVEVDRHPDRAAARAADRRGRARRAHHARAHPAPRRADRDGRRRAGDRRPRRQRRCAAAGRLPAPQRPSASAPRSRDRLVRQGADRALPRRSPAELPIVVCPDGQMLRNPTETELARCIGLVATLDPDRLYDVAIVGAGPAGLATAVYAASEGLSVAGARLPCVRRPGRRLGAHRELPRLSRPASSGMALMGRAYNQAQKFGAEMVDPGEATAASLRMRRRRLSSCSSPSGERVKARAVVIASGARYRRLDVDEPGRVRDDERALSGPRRSKATCAPTRRWRWSAPATRPARRRSISPARSPRRSGCSARGGSLEATMSRYLVDRIGSLPNVEVLTQRRGHRARRQGRAARGDPLAAPRDGEERCADPAPVPVHRRRPEHRLADGLGRDARW